MKSPVLIFLSSALLIGLLALLPSVSVRLPGDDRGYEPGQPIAFSHRVHAGELSIDCGYCHTGAAVGPTAGVPEASICMNCHGIITAGSAALEAERTSAKEENRQPRRIVSPELAKLYATVGTDEHGAPVAGHVPVPIRWTRVHDLADYVVFDHRVHVARGVDCAMCHGPVETMERVRQVKSFTMGFCVDCHRANSREGRGAVDPAVSKDRRPDHVNIDCIACHI